jgi:SnoaL-like protein
LEPWALQFAEEWIAAWNSHDLERILAHYVDDVVISSPLIVERMNEPSGVLRGKAAVRPYWAKGLAAKPPLKFELLAVHRGVNRLGLVYRSVGRRFALDILTLDDERRVTHAVALYGDADAAGFGRSVLEARRQ